MIKIVVFPSKITYNSTYKTVHAEPSLKVRFVRYAKRNKKHTNFRRTNESYPLWRNRFDSTVLQKAETQVASAKPSKIFSSFQPVSSYRTYLSHYLCLNCWHTTFDQNKNPSGQWVLSTSHWPQKLSLCQQLASFPETSESQNYSKYYQGSGLFATKDVSVLCSQNKLSFRSRLFCTYRLWQIYRRSQSGLQSRQKRKKVLSSLILFRSQFQRLLAQYSKTWEYRFFNRSSRIFQQLFKQASSLYLSYPSPSRCWFLQSQTYRTSRGEKYWLRNCCQNYQANQMAIGRPALSQIQKRLGSSRIPLHAPQLEKASQIYSYPQTNSRKRFRPINSFHHETIFLSSLCNQSPSKAGKCLVFLSGPGTHRKIHQRIKREFYSGQNSHQQLPGKSILFPFTPSCLRYSQLVQEDMPAAKISQCYPRDYPYRIFSNTSKVSENRQQEYAQTAIRIYSRTSFRKHYAEN